MMGKDVMNKGKIKALEQIMSAMDEATLKKLIGDKGGMKIEVEAGGGGEKGMANCPMIKPDAQENDGEDYGVKPEDDEDLQNYFKGMK